MSEISKLKSRLKNVKKNSVEYRMTVSEAQSLIKEFESLEKQLLEKDLYIQQTLSETSTTTKQEVRIKILDGGTF